MWKQPSRTAEEADADGQHHSRLTLNLVRRRRLLAGAAAARRLKAELAQAEQIATAAGTGGDRYSVRRAIGKRADGTPDRQQVIAVRAAALLLRSSLS